MIHYHFPSGNHTILAVVFIFYHQSMLDVKLLSRSSSGYKHRLSWWCSIEIQVAAAFWLYLLILKIRWVYLINITHYLSSDMVLVADHSHIHFYYLTIQFFKQFTQFVNYGLVHDNRLRPVKTILSFQINDYWLILQINLHDGSYFS